MRFYLSFMLSIALRTIIALFGIWCEGRSVLMRDRSSETRKGDRS
ncbi:hypothetical protein [Microcoleus sp. EPA2]